MKKKILSLVLVLAMAMTMVLGASVTSFAADPTSANVTVSIYVPIADEAVAIDANVKVFSDAYERYGGSDNVAEGQISALDVLVTCHEKIFGNINTLYLWGGETGKAYIRDAFGFDDGWDYTINGVYDNTGTEDGYSDVSKSVVKDGDVVTFFADESSVVVSLSYMGAALGDLGNTISGTAETSITIPVSSLYAVNNWGFVDGPAFADYCVPEFYLTQPVEGGEIQKPIIINSVSDIEAKYYNMEEVDAGIATVETNADGDAVITFHKAGTYKCYLQASFLEKPGADLEEDGDYEILAADADAHGYMVPVEITFDIAEKPAPVKDETAKTGDITVAFGAMIALLIAAGTAAVALKRKED